MDDRYCVVAGLYENRNGRIEHAIKYFSELHPTLRAAQNDARSRRGYDRVYIQLWRNGKFVRDL